jgi:hypothetical protein
MSQNEVRRAHTAYSSLTDTVLAVGEVIAELGVVDAAAVIFFVSPARRAISWYPDNRLHDFRGV